MSDLRGQRPGAPSGGWRRPGAAAGPGAWSGRRAWRRAGPAPSAPAAGLAGEPQRCGLALASLICGLVPCGCNAGLLAIIVGHIALRRIKQSDGALTGHGMAVAGTILGYVFVAIWILVVVASVVIPMILGQYN